MRKTSNLIAIIVISFGMMISNSVVASDGRIEINQVSITEAGGFPFTIDKAGSYVLTSDLVVPASTDGLIIDANGVNIDLNGFSISGPATCSPGNCPS